MSTTPYLDFMVSDLISERQRVDRFHSGTTIPARPRDTELTRTQYALVFLPGLIAGRLCDLGYFKRTLFISRSAAPDLL